MALGVQQKAAQHGQRRGHSCYETENGDVVLQADPKKMGESRYKPISFDWATPLIQIDCR